MTDNRRFAPATERNRDAIVDVLLGELSGTGLVIEVASGTGEHAVHFARAFPQLEWQPSDPSHAARASIASWVVSEAQSNILPPIDLDASSSEWSVYAADAIVCINMVHISPWEATEGLMKGAGRVLSTGGMLYLYGPYRQTGQPLEPSNAAFDQSLKARNSSWGIRELDDVAACAARNGLDLQRTVQMPANNLSVIFRKS